MNNKNVVGILSKLISYKSDNCGSVEISMEESSANDTDCPQAYVLTRVFT